jgi:hypothetical protein
MITDDNTGLSATNVFILLLNNINLLCNNDNTAVISQCIKSCTATDSFQRAGKAWVAVWNRRCSFSSIGSRIANVDLLTMHALLAKVQSEP